MEIFSISRSPGSTNSFKKALHGRDSTGKPAYALAPAGADYPDAEISHQRAAY
jgi:hypothetical protein